MMNTKIEAILATRTTRVATLHGLIWAAREATRAKLSPSSTAEEREFYKGLNDALYVLNGDPFDIEMRDALAEAERDAYTITPEMITAGAAAIANARAGRRGAPAITNIMGILPKNLKAEVLEDAEEALKAALTRKISDG